MPATDAADGTETDETVSYQFEMSADAWRAWTETIPRRQAIHSRLATLIEQDYRAATRDDDAEEEMGEKMMGVFATRIRIRAMQAKDAVRSDDSEEAIEQLEEMEDMADLLEG
jgi:hypothetical protein